MSSGNLEKRAENTSSEVAAINTMDLGNGIVTGNCGKCQVGQVSFKLPEISPEPQRLYTNCRRLVCKAKNYFDY